LDLNEITIDENPDFHNYKRSRLLSGHPTTTEHVTKSYTDADGVVHTPNGESHANEKDHKHDPIALDCTLFLFLMMAIGQFCKQIAHKTGIPYTSIITVLGVVVGVCSIKF
jgi:hypothetical protein